MIPAYEGKEPYIFVSYAHKDSPAVFHIVEQLSARGYRIWYDEGIEPGSEWPEYIANHLLGAEMVTSPTTFWARKWSCPFSPPTRSTA